MHMSTRPRASNSTLARSLVLAPEVARALSLSLILFEKASLLCTISIDQTPSPPQPRVYLFQTLPLIQCTFIVTFLNYFELSIIPDVFKFFHHRGLVFDF